MDTLKEKKCVVTGGAGFVGSHLVLRLEKEGARVVVYDNFVSGKREAVPEGVEIIEDDIRDEEKLAAVINGAHVVFHLAALASVPDSILRPTEYHSVNVGGTLNVLEAARKSGVKTRVINTSSASVYGNQVTLPVREDAVLSPQSPYAVQKRIAEEMSSLWSSLYDIETVSLRPFNLYGLGMNFEGAYASVIGCFKRMRNAGKPLSITGDGEQTRDYVHVSDVVSAFIAAATSPHVGKGEIINIASGTSCTINEVARMIGGPVEYIEERAGDIRHSCADIGRAKELLLWEPTVPFEEGMQELLQQS